MRFRLTDVLRTGIALVAEFLGLDLQRLENDFLDTAKKATGDADIAEARSMGLTGTPAFFVNGRYLRGAQPFSEFARVIDAELQRLGRPLPESRRGP